MSFKDDFAKAKTVQEQQQLIYNAAIAQGPPKDFYPISKNLPNGKSITYEVTSDYYKIDGIRVPMTAATAQALAAIPSWNVILPTEKMADQIFQEAHAQKGAIAPMPLSGSGYVDKYSDPSKETPYTGKQVVDSQISAAPAAIAYSEKVDEEIKRNPGAKLYAGHGKTIIQPEGDPKKLHFTGIERAEKDTQGNLKIKKIQPTAAPHSYDSHSEYITYVRFVKNDVTITNIDGTKQHMTMDQFLNDPNLYQILSKTQGIKTYNVKSNSPSNGKPMQPAKPSLPSEVAHHKYMGVDTPTSTTIPVDGVKSMVDVAFNRVESLYKKSNLHPLKKLEYAITEALGKNAIGTIIDSKNNLLTTYDDIDRSVQLCVGYLINKGKVKEAQAVLDALDNTLTEPAPSATTFVVPKEMSQAEIYEPSLHQQIGRSQIDPPQSSHNKQCPHCKSIIENIYLLENNKCPNCQEKI